MDGGNQFCMDDGADGSSGSGYDYTSDNGGVTKEKILAWIKEELGNELPFGSKMVPQIPEEEWTRKITNYLQYSGAYVPMINVNLQNALRNSGFKDETQIRDIASGLLDYAVNELRQEFIGTMQAHRELVLAEMKPIFDMLKDPSLALSARVKAFSLE